MKKIFFGILLMVSMAASAQTYDTIWGRSPYYHYSRWYDTCPFFLNDSDAFTPSGAIIRASYLRAYEEWKVDKIMLSDSTWGDTLRVKGLSCMVFKPDLANTRPDPHWYHLVDSNLPEYLYLGVYDRENDTLIYTADSLRWDTVTPKLMMLPRHADPSSGYERCWAYEVYFKEPITVYGKFHIAGSMFSNECLNDVVINYIPTLYVGMDMHSLKRGTMCWSDNMGSSIWGVDQKYEHMCRHGEWHWNPSFRTNPFHLIVQPKRAVDAVPCDTEWGSVEGGGQRYDSTYITLTAVPNRGYAFSHWSDGDSSNPRQVFITSDTSFVAYFSPKAAYRLELNTTHPVVTSVSGDGVYYDGDTASIQALGSRGLAFEKWNDGDTANPRQVTVVSDTAFTALFRLDYVGVETTQTLPFSLTPNPAHDRVVVSVGDVASCQVAVRDESGKLLASWVANESTFVLDITSYPAGVYYVTLQSGQRVATQKVVKQ